MSDLDEYFANQRTYSEMLAEAKKIHPDLRVRLVNETEWEFWIPTNKTEKPELSEEYKGTRAWELYESQDYGGYGNELERYRYKQGYSEYPLDAVAEVINLQQEQHEWAQPVRGNLLAEHGLSEEILEQFWKSNAVTEEEINKSNDIFSKYKEAQHKTGELMTAEFADKWATLKEKWNL